MVHDFDKPHVFEGVTEINGSKNGVQEMRRMSTGAKSAVSHE
jgi:hypothetical protein